LPALPAFLNSKCGNANAAREALSSEGFELEVVEPEALAGSVRAAVTNRAPRILVAGGDGTIATAAAAVARTDTELAILPGGTLNHFAKDNGIPTDLSEAAKVAANGVVKTVDLAYLGDLVFLNTSSIGMYVSFVRAREKLERRLGYRAATFLAALQMFWRHKRIAVRVEVDGEETIYRTPLLFIGVGERDLKVPALGSRVPNGKRGLHVMIVRGRKPGRFFAHALAAAAKGAPSETAAPEFESFIVDRCRVDLSGRSALVALDGELQRVTAPLEYRIERDALKLVVPAPDSRR
jgi:diacylglycerol kinase family enzyme